MARLLGAIAILLWVLGLAGLLVMFSGAKIRIMLDASALGSRSFASPPCADSPLAKPLVRGVYVDENAVKNPSGSVAFAREHVARVRELSKHFEAIT
jgi:hypothetical protein